MKNLILIASILTTTAYGKWCTLTVKDNRTGKEEKYMVPNVQGPCVIKKVVPKGEQKKCDPKPKKKVTA